MAQQSNAQRRARGLHRLVLWLPKDYITKLDALCEDSGYSRADIIEGMIDCETDEVADLRAGAERRKPPQPFGNGGNRSIAPEHKARRLRRER